MKPVVTLSKAVRISPRKVGVVSALIRNRSVEDAIVILDHTPRGAALAVKKAVLSARSNAEHNFGLKPDTLRITEISVTPGPRYKRYRAAARGRALRFQRKTSHIRLIVDGEKRVIKKPTAKTESKEQKND